MTFINLKEAANKPAPGHVTIFVKAIKEAALGYKAYKVKRAEEKTRQKEQTGRDKERLESITEKLKQPVPKYPEPLEASFLTFQKLALKYAKVKKGGDKKGNELFSCPTYSSQAKPFLVERRDSARAPTKNGRRLSICTTLPA